MLTTRSDYQTAKFAIEARAIQILEGYSDASRAPVTFAAAWTGFAEAVQRATNSSVPAISANKAWKCFRPAISTSYKDESDFSNALFSALRKSLTGLCEEPAEGNPGTKTAARKNSKGHAETDEPTQADRDDRKPAAVPRRGTREQRNRDGPTRVVGADDKNTKRKREQLFDPPISSEQDEPVEGMHIRLLNSNVGFTTGMFRNQHLGFPPAHGMSSEKSFVDHSCVIFRDQERANKKQATGASAAVRKQEPQFDDVTAFVELKLSGSSCSEYNPFGKPGLKRKDFGLQLSSSHGPIAQALMSTMDVWLCLARRGLAIQSLPVVVLAARKLPTPTKEKLCCMQGGLHIPNSLSSLFHFQLDRCLKFSKNNDGAAIAIYLATMATGLNHAYRMNQQGNKSPVTLCCSTPIRGLQLLASPIPDAQQETDMVIGQGELYRATDQRISINAWISRFGEHVCFAGAKHKMAGCLVKISHKTVHNSFVHIRNCWLALRDLASTVGVHDVLLACALKNNEMCLVTVMEDLSPTFRSVSLSTFPDRNLIWTAFLALAENALLPLADRDIVHTDIRCIRGNQSSYRIFNILGRSENGSIELRLIDYESLCKFRSHDSGLDGLQADAVSVKHFHFASRSAHVFLCYQVLWMAYVLHETPDQTSHAVDAGTLVRNLLSGTSRRELRVFRRFLGHRLPALTTHMDTLNKLTDIDDEPPENHDERPDNEPAPLDTRRAEVLEILRNLDDLF
jgi:hypothetical protein